MKRTNAAPDSDSTYSVSKAMDTRLGFEAAECDRGAVAFLGEGNQRDKEGRMTPSPLQQPRHEPVRMQARPFLTRTGPPMGPSIARRRVEITNEYGLHVRPAEKFVKLALKFRSEVRVRQHGRDCNGKSILDLMTLAAERGSWLELEARGPDAEEAVAALARLIASDFEEESAAVSSPEQAQADRPAGPGPGPRPPGGQPS